jgi:hypothetical protein
MVWDLFCRQSLPKLWELAQMTDFKWDNWQECVLAYEGNITIRSGRQVGKSEVISAKAAQFAKKHAGTTTLIIAASQRQSSLLFEKTRAQIEADKEIEFAEEPTLTKMILKNGSKIYCLPAGRTGYFIRGFTIDLLIADEAAYIPEEVWKAVIPMIAVSRQMRGLGWIILLSTPFGKGGYYYLSFTDVDFKQFHISSENCPRIPKDFLIKEKSRMSKQDYMQEYCGEFVDDYRQYFPTELIKKCMTFIDWDFSKDYNPKAKYFLGVDVARYGGDENAFCIAELENNKMKIVKTETTTRKPLTDTAGYVKVLHDKWKFSRIFIDDGGVGGGLTDILQEKCGKRVVIGLNNASKRVYDPQIQDERPRGILKEDLYSNALILMESGKIEIISDLTLLRSMKSVIFEYGAEKMSKNVKIYGDYAHLCEAFVRACWCSRDKALKLFIA